jgi:hypothetical protein
MQGLTHESTEAHPIQQPSLLLALAPLAAYAQSSNGSISGTATDESGGALPGVSVTAANAATGVSRTVVSNEKGHYEI